MVGFSFNYPVDKNRPQLEKRRKHLFGRVKTETLIKSTTIEERQKYFLWFVKNQQIRP